MRAVVFAALTAAVIVVLPGVALAYCPEPRSYSYGSVEAQINAYIDHLICLHNEQVQTLNQHAEGINGLGDEIDGIRRNLAQAVIPSLKEQRQAVSELEAENLRLRRQVDEQEVRLRRLENLLN